MSRKKKFFKLQQITNNINLKIRIRIYNLSMEWEIPEPLSIRPCQKPSQFKARQLSLHPVRLKKLPEWVDKASFQVSTKKIEQQYEVLTCAKENQTQPEVSFLLWNKYKNKEKYCLIYERGEENYNFNQSFSYEYIPANYKELEQNWSSQEKRKKKSDDCIEDYIRFQPPNQGKNLQFDSKFQCGNLSKVYQGNSHDIEVKNENQFHLLMQNDINTHGYNQWFAFSINNRSNQHQTIDLKIVNFVLNSITQVKPHSLYKKGMKPWFIEEGVSAWRQIQENCTYKRSNARNSDGDNLYELNFQINLSPGLTLIAMMPIYSYTRLCSQIEKWKTIKGMRIYHKKVYSLVNNIVPILEYIPHADEESDQNEDQIKWSDTIVVFGRTHPGEVWSSFLMQEFIQTIIHYHKSNVSKFRYLIFPMINPDGVIYGNFRCDFSGVDLNRVWIDPSRFTQCSIYQIKKILNRQFENKKAKYFLDFHSHSKRFNIFAYTSAETFLQSRLVSDIIRLSDQNKVFDPVRAESALSREFLTESQSTFLSSKQISFSRKKSTARAFMSKLTERGRSMTIQISFHGYEDKKSQQNSVKQFSVRDLNDFAWSLLKKLHDVLNLKEEVILAKKILQKIYNDYHSFPNHENHSIILNLPKKQHKTNELQNQMSQDSDSQPQKYYTNETKKTIRSKNGELLDCKSFWNTNNNKKGYLKQTESTVKKIQQFRKEKNKNNQTNEQIKIKTVQTKNENHTATKHIQQFKKKSVSESFIQNQQTQENYKQKTSQKQLEHQNKIQNNPTLGVEKQNVLRKKIIQSRKKELRFGKEKRCETQASKNQKLDDKLHYLTNSVFQPVILQIEETKKYEPAFGQFLTKNKRTASRRYKTVTKEEYSIYKTELAKLNTNGLKPNFNRKGKPQNQVSVFLQEKMFVQESNLSKSNHNTDTKLLQRQQSVNQNREGRITVKKSQQMIRKKSKKNTGLDRIHNFKNIYLVQRKKIIDMMKKETRFCNQTEKESTFLDDIEEIIQKRKRAKTQHDQSKNYFEDQNIFYQIKLGKAANSNKPSDQINNYSRREMSTRRFTKNN